MSPKAAARAAANRAWLADVLDRLDDLPVETLDEYRRLGETLGARVVLGNSGVTGDALAAACDAELAGRLVG